MNGPNCNEGHVQMEGVAHKAVRCMHPVRTLTGCASF